MKPEARQQSILGRLRAVQKEWKVDELAASLKVSPLTIRRDLDSLSRTGTVIRTLGGCIAAGKVQNSVYQKRVATNFDRKLAIGLAAAHEARKSETLLINDGSTTFHLASCLGEVGPITVYTNSIAMIGELSRFPAVRLYVLGGRYDAEMFCLGGSLMERVLETVNADVVFMGTDAIDANGRCLAADQDSARTAQVMLRRGKRRILLADAAKTGSKGNVAYGSLGDFDLWITTRDLPKQTMRKFGKMTKIKAV